MSYEKIIQVNESDGGACRHSEGPGHGAAKNAGDAVAATVTLARGNGLRAEEPAVLVDLFSLMMHLRPAPEFATLFADRPLAQAPTSAFVFSSFPSTPFT